MRNILTNSGVYRIALSGPGMMRIGMGAKGAIMNVLGTTSDSSLSITQVRSPWHASSKPLPIKRLNVGSGQIGSVTAVHSELVGPMTPLTTSVDTLVFGFVGPGGSIDIRGALTSGLLGGLGPGARVKVAGDVGSLQVSDVASAAQAQVGGGIGTLQVETLDSGAQVDIAGSVQTMTMQAVNLGPTGHFVVGGDLNGSLSVSGSGSGTLTIDSVNINGGKFAIGRDSLSPIIVKGNMNLNHDGRFQIGRDQLGSLSIGGTLTLDTGGQLFVGRNLASLSVVGDVLVNPIGSGISVGGDLNGFRVGGIFRGQGSASAIDLAVGLNLVGFTVVGGGPDLGGLQSANISVAKNINGLDVAHGIYRSWITAGVSIDGVTVGADGVTAVLNSELDAGTSITNVVLNGDLKSDFPTDPGATGYPTRIIAGKSRAGQYLANGLIDGFTINGNLIDSVLAASVAPYGGDGTLPPPTPYYGGTPRVVGPPPGDFGFNTYDAPAGVTDGTIKNYSIRSTGVNAAVWDRTVDPTIDDTILESGTINVKLTGSVVSSPHDDHYDFTGIFAMNTRGVNGGPLPPSTT